MFEGGKKRKSPKQNQKKNVNRVICIPRDSTSLSYLWCERSVFTGICGDCYHAPTGNDKVSRRAVSLVIFFFSRLSKENVRGKYLDFVFCFFFIYKLKYWKYETWH